MSRQVTTISTNADIEAYNLLFRAGRIALTTDSTISPSDAGNTIILLAEKIKSERSVISMNMEGRLNINEAVDY